MSWLSSTRGVLTAAAAWVFGRWQQRCCPQIETAFGADALASDAGRTFCSRCEHATTYNPVLSWVIRFIFRLFSWKSALAPKTDILLISREPLNDMNFKPHSRTPAAQR
jgi:hypothetical protein